MNFDTVTALRGGLSLPKFEPFTIPSFVNVLYLNDKHALPNFHLFNKLNIPSSIY